MKSLTSAINVQENKEDKEQATIIGGMSFETKNLKPSKNLSEALQEGEQILEDIKNGKRKPYTDLETLFESLKR